MLNKVTESNSEFMQSKSRNPDRIACVMPQKEDVMNAGLTGTLLDGEYEEIKQLIEKIS